MKKHPSKSIGKKNEIKFDNYYCINFWEQINKDNYKYIKRYRNIRFKKIIVLTTEASTDLYFFVK